MSADTRDELRRVIGRLADEHVPAVLAFARLVQSGRVDVRVSASTSMADDSSVPGSLFSEQEMKDDPMLRILASAPEDDEPLSDDEAAGVTEGLAEYERGDFVDADVAKAAHLR